MNKQDIRYVVTEQIYDNKRKLSALATGTIIFPDIPNPCMVTADKWGNEGRRQLVDLFTGDCFTTSSDTIVTVAEIVSPMQLSLKR